MHLAWWRLPKTVGASVPGGRLRMVPQAAAEGLRLLRRSPARERRSAGDGMVGTPVKSPASG
jgi:hypothetical protein